MTLISSPSNSSVSFFGDPHADVMVVALASQDEELAKTAQKTTEAVGRVQAFLQQTFQDFGASGAHLEELLARAQAHNAELEQAQEKEMRDVKDESAELERTLASQKVQIDELALKHEQSIGQLRAKIPEIRNACRPSPPSWEAMEAARHKRIAEEDRRRREVPREHHGGMCGGSR